MRHHLTSSETMEEQRQNQGLEPDTAADPAIGLVAALPWGEIEAVAIVTTADGPVGEDLFWTFATRADPANTSSANTGSALRLPGSWISGAAFDALLARLPGADLGRVIAAMGTTEPRTFCVWRRDRSPQQDGEEGLVARFSALVARSGGDAASAAPLARALLASWGAAERRYHDRQHLCDCLFELDALRQTPETDAACAALAQMPAIEFALWYHDAVYDTHRQDSEERSAQRLVAELSAAGVQGEVVAAAARLVRATAHLSRPAGAVLGADEALVVDIDLAILGQQPLRFADFEDGIAEEYRHVPTPLLRWKRRGFLRRLLASSPIFATATMQARHEAAARANLTQLLASSRYTGWGMVG